VQLTCPKRIFDGGYCSTTPAHPAGYVTAEVSGMNYVMSGSASAQTVDLVIDFGVGREVLDLTLELARDSDRPNTVEIATSSGNASTATYTTVGRFAISTNCAAFTPTTVRCGAMGLTGVMVFDDGTMPHARARHAASAQARTCLPHCTPFVHARTGSLGVSCVQFNNDCAHSDACTLTLRGTPPSISVLTRRSPR